jgi:hypothetical protein
MIAASLYGSESSLRALFTYLLEKTSNRVSTTDLYAILDENKILTDMYLVEFESLVQDFHNMLNSSPFDTSKKPTRRRYIHPAFYRVGQAIRRLGVDFEYELKKRNHES